MKKITITCHIDNSFNVKVEDGKLLSLCWKNDSQQWELYDSLGDFKMSFGSDVLPDWTSIIQYLQETY